MKKTCFGCRALDYNGESARCDLGYKQTKKYRGTYLYTEPVPTEECPKPRTYDRYFGLLENLERAQKR